jgi:hypothetical protein
LLVNGEEHPHAFVRKTDITTNWGFGAASRTSIPPPASLSRKWISAFSKADWMRCEASRRSAQQTTGRLFGLFWPLTIAQSHTRAAAVLVDEFDADCIAKSLAAVMDVSPSAKAIGTQTNNFGFVL